MFGLFKKAVPAIEKKSSQAWALHGNLPTARWNKRTYESFSREAYQFNVIAYSAITRVASAVSNIRWQVRSGDKVLTSHPLLDLLKRPNPAQSGHEWWTTRVGYAMLSGNIYDEAVISGERIIELWPLRPDRMKIVPGRLGLPSAFIYDMGGKKVRYASDPLTGQSPINHTKLFSPLDDWYGMSPIEAAAFGIDQHNEGVNWIQSLLQNSARPSGALIVDSETPLGDDEYRHLKEEIETKYSGSDNAGRPMLLEGGLDWKQMGMSPVDMEILKAREMAARDISLAFGVPPLLLNIPGDNTYANYREARLGFYEDTIIPFVNYQLAELNHFFDPFFAGARLEIAMDSIEAIAEKRMKQWAMADASDDITLNESRRMKGLEPLPDPLGSTLMTEIRAGTRGDSPAPELTKSLWEDAYGQR
jgi:HK97 family phage portal protein